MASDPNSVFQTPEAYLTQLIARVQVLGSRLTDFNTGSIARTTFEALATALSQQSAVVEQLRLDSYLASATGGALDAKAADYQVFRNPAITAVGSVTISRPAGGTALTVPAGWSPLQTVPAPGQQPVQVLTTADAVFASADLTHTVAAVAVVPGASGNLAAGIELLPLNAVAGFATDGGFAVASGTGFTQGVDAESDDALRTRVPVAVQGRVKGRAAAYLAAALGVPGVISANVLRAGDARGDGTTLPANAVEIYWEGDASLASAVASAVAAASTINQSPNAIAATAAPLTVGVTVYCQVGVDTVALAANVKTAVTNVVTAGTVGGTIRQSAAVQAMHDVTDVVAVSLPMSDFRLASETAGTAHDVSLKPTQYATLPAANLTVTVVTL